MLNVTGDVDVSGNISLPDTSKIKFGTDTDLEIYHDGSNSYIDDIGDGSLFIRSGTTYIQNSLGTKTSISTNAGAGQTLYFNNTPIFATVATGVDITGTLDTSGLATLNSAAITTTLDVTGVTTVDVLNAGVTALDSVTVTGLSELDGGINVADTFVVDANGNVSTTGTLQAVNTTITGTLDVALATNLNSTTSSTTSTTGALIVDGGVGIAENLNVGANVGITGNTIVSGTLDTTLATTLASTLDVTGTTTVDVLNSGVNNDCFCNSYRTIKFRTVALTLMEQTLQLLQQVQLIQLVHLAQETLQ